MYNDVDIKRTILSTAAGRGAEKSTCPSEIARTLFPVGWRRHMKRIVELAIELQQQGKVLITQKGKPLIYQPSEDPYGSKSADFWFKLIIIL